MQPGRPRSLSTDVFRRQLDPAWIELKPDESLESVAYSFPWNMPQVCRSASASVTDAGRTA